ncbi:MAG: adenylate/guanylate cyclase domain-containing protein [Nitrospinaceae bacterium]|nr:MAG: adenylate/guanylate cyclase domain-containing protein [Nitrospinaceae bacterium]
MIAAIDEKSIDELGRWPWPRKHLTRLVEKLVEKEAKVIGFDMVFSSPDESSGIETLKRLQEELDVKADGNVAVFETVERYIQNSDDDGLFARALGKSQRSVLGYFFHFHPEGLDHLSDRTLHEFLQDIKSAQFVGFIKSNRNLDLSLVDFRSAFAVESNIPILSKAVKQVGFISIDVEPDGSIRKLPLIVKYHDKKSNQDYFFPPLAIRVLEKFLEGTLLFRVGEFGVEKVLLDGETPLQILTNDKGEAQINFMGPQGTFPHFSVTDIIHDRLDAVPPGSLKDKIVLVGATAPALESVKITPFDPNYPGVEIHATVIDNFLHKNSLHQPKSIDLIDMGYLIVLGFLLTWVYSGVRPGLGLLISVLTLVLHLCVSHWVMVYKRFWLTDVFPLMENVLIMASIMVYRYGTEMKQKQEIQNVFSKYLPEKVIDQLMKDPGRLKLGGEQKELTALFTDIVGFTSLSEKYSPEKLMNFLNAYLTEMTGILFKYEGTLDKYDGDAIKSFFGAPLYFKEHAKRACWVAIEMQDRLRVLRQHWRKSGRPELYIRIGINTGLMVVGNIGSKNRMNYGINGDSVNLAARLEAANKEYGTFCLISDTTYQQAKNDIEVRELEYIRVVGRVAPVKVYELLGKSGQMDERIRRILPLYYEGLRHYRKRNWEAAIASFEKVLKFHPKDGPTRAFRNRCLRFKLKPPPEIWDGVFHLPTK